MTSGLCRIRGAGLGTRCGCLERRPTVDGGTGVAYGLYSKLSVCGASSRVTYEWARTPYVGRRRVVVSIVVVGASVVVVVVVVV